MTSQYQITRRNLLLRLRAERKVSFARARLIRELLAEITIFRAGKGEFIGIVPEKPFKIEAEI